LGGTNVRKKKKKEVELHSLLLYSNWAQTEANHFLPKAFDLVTEKMLEACEDTSLYSTQRKVVGA